MNQNQSRKKECENVTKKALALIIAAGKPGKFLSTSLSILNNT